MTVKDEPPKLYVNKPRKTAEPISASASASAATGSKVDAATQGGIAGSASSSELKPPGPSRFWHRFRSAFGVLLVANFVIGGYVLLTKSNSSKDDKPENKEEEASVSSETDLVTVSSALDTSEKVMEKEEGSSDVVAISLAPSPSVPVAESIHLKVLQPKISEDKQREVLKWILEEKRRIKPANSAEKKKIDEEKKLLKEVLRAKSLPTI